MTNRNNINSRLLKVNKQLSNLNGNNGLNFKNIKNNSSKGGNTFKSSKVFVIIGIILLVIVLGVAGYFLYNYFTRKNVFSTSKLLIPYIHDASIDKLFSNSSIPSSVSGNEYNINMWLYVNDYNYRRDADKCILFKGSKTHISNCFECCTVEKRDSIISLFENTIKSLVFKVGRSKHLTVLLL